MTKYTIIQNVLKCPVPALSQCDHRWTPFRKQRHAKFFLRLVQSSPIGRLNCAKKRETGNAIFFMVWCGLWPCTGWCHLC